MGSCFSSEAVELPRGESGRPICGQCQRSCCHTDGRFYLKCLQCSNNFNICDRCYIKDYYHPVHVYAFVNNEDRHRFMEQIAERMEGWPILNSVPSVERQPLKCFNITADDNLQPKRCPNPISWICLQCPITFSLCHSCMALPFQHTRHVFTMAETDNLQNFILSQQNSGMLPLSYLKFTDSGAM